MIHEVILSLIGQTGDIIILVDKKKRKNPYETNINIDQYCFEVNSNIHVFLNSEIKVINEIVELGYYFYIINTFCLLVKKNTIYKNLTHIHKFNQVNAYRRDQTSRGGNGNESVSSNSSTSVCSSDSCSSDSGSFYSSDGREKKEDGLGDEKNNNTWEGTQNDMNKKNVRDEESRRRRSRVDDYFGIILKHVKSMNDAKPYGYYANGIYNEIQKFIKRYIKKISDIEEYINNNNNTPLTQILAMLEKKREEIIIIIDIIKTYLELQKKEEKHVIEGESRDKTKALIDYLYDNCVSGNSRIKNIYYKYFKSLGKILLHQICSWILYGQLIDPYYEFFVQKRQFIYTDDRKIFLSPEELYENLFLTNVQSLNFEWNYLFFQSLANMPECCIDKVIGRKILFIGKSVRILIRSNRWNTEDVTSLLPIIKILSKAFTKRAKEIKRKGVRRRKLVTPYDMKFCNETKNRAYLEEENNFSSVSDSSSYSEESTDLEEEETLNLYCKETFDITIEKIRRIVAYKLWKYIVRDINLIKIFDLYKDIYLLNSGDFYEYFLEKSWSLMHIPPNSKNEILLKIYAWKNASILVEDYFRINYEKNKKNKLKLCTYEDNFLEGNNNYGDEEDEFHFFSESKNNEFNVDNSENLVAKYFYPRISHKHFTYDSFEKEKLDNLILGGMSYIEEKKIFLNDFYRGINSLSKKKYYEYDNVFSVCINNYRQQILKGFKHGFDFSLNFNNFFDNRSANINIVGNEHYANAMKTEKNFLVGACFALVIQSVKNPLLYKKEVLESDIGYWGNLGDCLSVEIKVKFFAKNKGEGKDVLRPNEIVNDVQSINYTNENDSGSFQMKTSVMGDVEVEVSLYIGGRGISSFVHNNNNFLADYSKESILYSKLLKEKRRNNEYTEDEEKSFGKCKSKKRGADTNERRYNQYGLNDDEMKRSDCRKNRAPALKIQSNKQIFPDIDKNSVTKFRVRVNCLKHSFSVYLQKLDEYNITNASLKNKIKPIIHIRALDMTQAFSLDIGNAYIGFFTCPILFKHKLLKQKKKLEDWFQKFYKETLQTDLSIYKKPFFNVKNEKDTRVIENEMTNINRIVLFNNDGENADSLKIKNNKNEKIENLLMFSSYDCCVEIHRWFHQSYKSPIEIPEINVDNEILIFYDKQIRKNVKIHSGLNNWNNIEIHFKLTWPIALIINTNTIYTYNAIFQFRFLLGRIYYNLKILCYHNRQLIKYLNNRKGVYLFSHLFSIRYKMQFFFFQLIKYLQEDIINQEYKLMTTQIHKSKDFEYTKTVHDLYISQIATKCFLRLHDLTTPLMELIDTCFKFCYFFQCLIENELFVDILNCEQNENIGSSNNVDETYDEDLKQVVEKLLQYNETFDTKYALVLNEMTSISMSTNHANLTHLLTILDFNNYATKIRESIRQKEQKETEAHLSDTRKKKITADTYEENDLEDKILNDMRYHQTEKEKKKDSAEYINRLNETNASSNYSRNYDIEKQSYSKNVLNETNFTTKSIVTQNMGDNLNQWNNNLLKKRVVNNFSNLLNNNISNNDYIKNSNIYDGVNGSMSGFSSVYIKRNMNDISLNNMSVPVFDNANNRNLRFEMENSIMRNNPLEIDNVNNKEIVKRDYLGKKIDELPSVSNFNNNNNNNNNNNISILTDTYSNMKNTYNNKKWTDYNTLPVNGMNNNNTSISANSYRDNMASKIDNVSFYNIGNSASNLNFTADSNLLETNNLFNSKLPKNSYNTMERINAYYQQSPFEMNNMNIKLNNEDTSLNKFGITNNMAENEITINRNDIKFRRDLVDSNLTLHHMNDPRRNMNSMKENESNSLNDLKIKNNFNIQELIDNYNYQYDGYLKNKHKDEKSDVNK